MVIQPIILSILPPEFFNFWAQNGAAGRCDTANIASFSQKVHVYSLQFPEATSHQWSNHPWFDNRVLSATITCGSLEENGHFKHFLEIADNEDTPVSRRTIFWKMHTSVGKEGKRNCYEEVGGPIICVNNNGLWYDRRLHSMSASNPWSPLHLSPTCWTVGTLRTNIEGSESLLPFRRSQKNMVFARR